MVNPQVCLRNLTFEAGIPGNVMLSFIDGKHIVSVPHYHGLFVDMIDACLDEDIDGGTEDLFDVGEDNPTPHPRTTKQLTWTYNTAYNTSRTYHTQSSPEM